MPEHRRADPGPRDVAPLAEVRVRRERRRGPAVVVAEPTLEVLARPVVHRLIEYRRSTYQRIVRRRARGPSNRPVSPDRFLSPSEKRDRMMTSGTAIVQVGVVVIAVLGLWIGARALVDATVRVARRFGVGELTIGLTIVAMGTSTPELVVTVDAALAGLGEIGVGNIIGSNAYNLAFILGAVSLLRVIPVERSLVHRDGAALVLSTLVGRRSLRSDGDRRRGRPPRGAVRRVHRLPRPR